MPTFNFLDLPCSVFLYIISFLKDVAPLRLVCRPFNTYVSEAMFDTLAIQLGPCREPYERPQTRFVLSPAMLSVHTLAHQLDTLYTKKQPVALRRAKALKIFVSRLFRYSEPLSEDTIDPSAIREKLQSITHDLTTKLPSIIRSLGNLRQTTICLSEFEPEKFTHDISNALLTLPYLTTLSVIFRDQNFCRSLPIIGSPRLVTMKMSWPLKGTESSSLSRSKGGPVYSQIFGATTRNTSLKHLELRSTNLLSPQVELYQLCALPCLEELVIDNVPVSLSEDNVKEMRGLLSLRLAYGRPSCSGGESYAGVWKGLKEAGTKLKRLSVDGAGEALLAYLRSYVGLETLELKLERDADHSYAQDLFEQGLQPHEGSLKSLRVALKPQSNPFSTWFFEYWKEWIPSLGALERLEATTSMNLFSEHDAGVLVRHITDVVARIPTLRAVEIRHLYEGHLLFPEEQQFTRVVRGGVEPTRVHGDYTHIPHCVVNVVPLRQTFSVEFHREGDYGFLALV